MANPPPLSQQELDEFFPRQRPPIKPGAFEIGLCLGGTVSAGAYTGGVLDCLIEVLDAWTSAKDAGSPDAPPHEVVISNIAGASGGAINGAILLRAAGWEFNHGADDGNPFYSGWTQGVDLMRLLGPGHGENDLVSLFNTESIDAQAAATIAYQGRPLGSGTSPARRSYLADPLRLMMMVGNVTGIPYSVGMTGESGLTHDLVAHADYVRFGLTVDGGVAAAPRSRPDELALSSHPGSPQNWDMIGKAALATSAFPLAFRSRPLSRPAEQARYRATLVPGQDGPGSGTVLPLVPKWDTLMQGEHDPAVYNFVNVDGGAFNNEPLDMVRMALSGLDGRNPRDAHQVNRAVMLIDPFSDPEDLGPRLPPGLVGLIMPFLMSLIYQARYKPADIALAYSESAYSRFLIAPVGPEVPVGARKIGKAAIASGPLGGFGGFVHADFLRYDYALGRLNAYRFLKRHFALPQDAGNPIFASWTGAQRQKYGFTATPAAGQPATAYLPIIPVMDTVAEPSLPRWPLLADLPAGLGDAIEGRLDAVYTLAKRAALSNGFWRAFVGAGLALPWRFYIRPAIRDFALKTLRDALRAQELLPPN